MKLQEEKKRNLQEKNQKKHITYLAYLSKFLLTTNSGPMFLNVALNKPCIFSDYIPLRSIMGNEMDIILPKMIFHKNNRIVSLKERFNDNFGSIESSDYYDQNGFKIMDNSSEIIRNSTIEMYEKVFLNKNGQLTENQKSTTVFQEKNKYSH